MSLNFFRTYILFLILFVLPIHTNAQFFYAKENAAKRKNVIEKLALNTNMYKNKKYAEQTINSCLQDFKLKDESFKQIISSVYKAKIVAAKEDQINTESNTLFKKAIHLATKKGDISLQIWTSLNFGFYLYTYRQYDESYPHFVYCIQKLNEINPDEIIQPLDTYKKMLEDKENLSAYLVINHWESPEEVQNAVRSVAMRKPLLEGAVLIGDIPVALIRNAQHMTTAFKMDEIKFPFNESSIASDRFYDDFDLHFRFLKKDSAKADWFYYELEESSPQFIQSDIYTSRIRSQKEGVEKYTEIASFLRKAVAARSNRDSLKTLLAFTGFGYNSESLTAWTDEQQALKEIFPKPFTSPHTARILNFRMDDKMKYRLFSELQRPDLDLAILNEHGEINRQFINNYPSGNSMEYATNLLKQAARTALRRAVQREQDTNKVKADHKKRYLMGEEWFEGALNNDSLRQADSILNTETDIFAADVQNIIPNSKIIIFNACYNGSFHQPENISAAYIFRPGNTLAVHGNSVNVLQDKWTIEQIGLLNHGVRIGTWAAMINTLESHVSGDPTWRFASIYSDLNSTIKVNKNNPAYWESILTKDDPALQSLALKMLVDILGDQSSALLVKTFSESSFLNVRMQSLALLSRIGNSDFNKVSLLALKDPYELIRRKAAEWMAKSGDDLFIEPLIHLLIERPNDERVVYNVRKSLVQMNPDKVAAEMEKQVNASTYLYNREEYLNQWMEDLRRNKDRATSTLETIMDKRKESRERVLAVRLIRNNTYHHLVPDFLKIAEDSSDDNDVRQNMIEALGWFATSYQKEKIMDACIRIQKNKQNTPVIQKEALQTLSRLQKWNLP